MNHSPVYRLKKKDAFCDQVINLVATVPEYEMLLLCGDMENTRTVLKKYMVVMDMLIEIKMGYTYSISS